MLVGDGSGDCLGFGKTARAQKRERMAGSHNRAWVTCNKRARGSLFAASRLLLCRPNDSLTTPKGRRTSLPSTVPGTVSLLRAPLKRARRSHGPSSTHEATLAPVRRDSAGVRNRCQKKNYPATASRGNNSPAQIRRRAIQKTLTGAPSRSASPASARPSAATPTTRTTAARSSGMSRPIGTRPARMTSSRRTRSPRR